MDKVDKFRELWQLNKKQLQQTSTSQDDRDEMEQIMMAVEEYLQTNLEEWEVDSSYFLYDEEPDSIIRQFTLKKGAANHQIVITPELEIRYADEKMPIPLLVQVHSILMRFIGDLWDAESQM